MCMARMQLPNAKAAAAPPPAAEARVPRSRQLRLDLLHTFEAAARHLSFTSAGAELALSQPAVSRQIQQLESSLGAALFERQHRALALTEAGRVMQRAVDDSLERLRDAAAGPQLFEEAMQPMGAPSLLRDKARPLASPADLAHHRLLTVDLHGAPSTVDWEPWLRLMGLDAVRMAHTMRFTQYGEAVAA